MLRVAGSVSRHRRSIRAGFRAPGIATHPRAKNKQTKFHIPGNFSPAHCVYTDQQAFVGYASPVCSPGAVWQPCSERFLNR